MSLLSRPTGNSAALVLRTWPCGESSAIASLLTRDHGYVKVIAKAARRPRSVLRPLIEPGRLVDVEFSLDPSRELQYLRKGAVELDPFGDSPTLQRTAFLLAALELADRCRPSETGSDPGSGSSSSRELFEICGAFVRMLSSSACLRMDLLFFAFEWELLARHGMTPEVNSCSSCGRPGNQEALEGAWFSPAEGGLVCSGCAVRQDVQWGKPLGREACTVFREFDSHGLGLPEGARMEPGLRREVGAHMHRFLGYHLPGYRLPAALDLLRAGKERSR